MNQKALFGIETAESILYGAAFALLLHRFCMCHFSCVEERKRGTLFCMAVIYPMGTAALFCIDDIFLLALLPTILIQITLVFLIVWLYRGEREAKILAAAVLLATTLLFSNFTESLLIMVYLFAVHLTGRDIWTMQRGLLEALLWCVRFLSIAGILSVLSKRMKGFFTNRMPRWYRMLSVPLFGIVFLWDLADGFARYGIFLRGGDHLNLYYNPLLSEAGICVSSAFCLCAAGFYVFGMERIETEQRKKEQYRSQVAFYRMLGEQYQKMESLRHDIKNHIIGLQGLLDNREWDKMAGYLQRMAEAGGVAHTEDMTGNDVVDALLYYKRERAARADIRWECTVNIPKACTVDEFDLGVIFGNILDNAAAACERVKRTEERFIKIQAGMARRCLLIEVTNSSASEEDVAKAGKDGGKIGAGKTDGIFMGTGLQNVRDAVDKYDGTLTLERKESSFRISILLPCGSTVCDSNSSV